MARARVPRILAACLGVATLMAGPALRASMPYPSPPPQDPYAYADYCFVGGPADLPPALDPSGTWWLTDYRGSDPQVIYNPQELYGVRGMGANRAWEVTTGRPDVLIAVVDSGIRWNQTKDCQLLRKLFLNRWELPVPAGGPNPSDRRFGGYDVNGDGAFNIADYLGDPRVTDANGNGWTDPEDLILLFSDGVDGDNNGYADDISGWDFFEGDNDPQDDVDFGHGSSQANHAAAEAALSGETCPEGSSFGFGRPPGTCPNCMVVPLRYSDSFVGDVNHFAEALLYAADLGARVVEVAAGTFNRTSFGQAAMDAARRRGVAVDASAADEAAAHRNWPAAYGGALVHNSIRDSAGALLPASYLYLNGCTNFGSYAFVAVPSESCSSQATGLASGLTGLLVSSALSSVERGDMTPYLRDDGSMAPFPLSAGEIEQLWRLSADDVDFSSAYPDHAFSSLWPELRPPWWPWDAPDGEENDYGLSGAILPTRRYATVRGWDYFTGYGRVNAARFVRYIGLEDPSGGSREFLPGMGPYAVGHDPVLSAQDRIPPEADISHPQNGHPYALGAGGELLMPDDPSSPADLVVRGRVAANRVTASGGTFDFVVEWAPGAQGAPAPGGLAQAAPDSEERSAGPWTEATRVCDLTAAFEGELARIPAAAALAAVAANPDPFAGEGDPTGPSRPERDALRIRLRVLAHPADARDTVNNEAVQQKSVAVYLAPESALLGSLGSGGRSCGGGGSPAYHDLDGDGRDELLLPTDDGLLHAFADPSSGLELPGWPVRTDPLPNLPASGENAYSRGEVPLPVFGSLQFGAPAVADLDDDGSVEVLAADLEGKVYAWESDGSLRPGFPVTADLSLSREVPCGPSTIPRCDDYAEGSVRDAQNQRDRAFFSAPSAGDLDPSTPGLEVLAACADGHLYAWHADGSPVAGWPVILRDPAKVASMDGATRRFVIGPAGGWEPGSKALATPALGDLDGDGRMEVVASVNEEYRETPNARFDPTLQQLLDAAGGGGNGRIYALRATGADTPGTPETEATAHTQDQAYLPGWPVPLAIGVLDLLPMAGQGGVSQPALLDADGDGLPEAAAATHFGPAYLLRGDGSSHLGMDGPVYRTCASEGGDFGPQSGAGDAPSLPAFPALSAGSLAPGAPPTLSGGCAGLNRLIDIVLPGRQEGAEDHLGLWGTGDGAYLAEAPAVVDDLQFFAAPIFADLSGDGRPEVVQGTAFGDLVAVGSSGILRLPTVGWTMGSAALGGAAGRPPALASFTREGFLRLYSSQAAGPCAGTSPASPWPRSGHDARNTGNLATDAERPYPVRDLRATPLYRGVRLSFTATGDDRACGKASRYEVRFVAGGSGQPSWTGAAPASFEARPPAPSGQPDAVRVSDLDPGVYDLLLRAYDDAGNGSAVASVRAEVPSAGFPGDCDGDGSVSIGEVQRAVNMFLELEPPACGVDSDGDGSVSIGEVQQVIVAFLGA